MASLLTEASKRDRQNLTKLTNTLSRNPLRFPPSESLVLRPAALHPSEGDDFQSLEGVGVCAPWKLRAVACYLF